MAVTEAPASPWLLACRGTGVVGALVWVGLFLAAGYLFGNLPFVKRNFSKVILAIIVVSVLPIVWEWWKHRRASAKARS